MRVNTKINVTKLAPLHKKLPNDFSFENEVNHVPMFVDIIGSEYVRTFQDLDPVKVEHDGCHKSKNVEVWAAKAFDEFRKLT
jgi:hypothetical protein